MPEPHSSSSTTTIDDPVKLTVEADGLIKSGSPHQGIELYEGWLHAHPSHPLRYALAFNCAVTLMAHSEYPRAAQWLRSAIEANPNFISARINLATALEKAGDNNGATVVLLELRNHLSETNKPAISQKVGALRNIARICSDPEVGESALGQAIELDINQLDLAHHWVNYRHARCKWPVLRPLSNRSVPELEELMLPLFMSMTSDDPRRLFEASQKFMDREISQEPITTAEKWPPAIAPGKSKLKIGYLSSDLRYHPIGYLMEDIFALHNQRRFEVIVYNIGDFSDDPLKQKIASAVSAWHEVRELTDKALARKIVDDGIDILLDINGHTKFQRPRLLAMKPAPIIVNWLGYPGSMGVGCHDYIIADDFIIPPSHERFYGEKVVRLPCYQPNSALWDVPERYSKKLLGLPEDAFVFCCFNGMVKITPEVFRRWMTILKAVPNSVLWLRGSGNDAAVHLRKEAEQQGVSPSRIVVLEFQPHTEYYACHRYADLFLDTFPYGAHTTASDALRMGIPIVTLAGEGFPSRVCGSLLHAVGLPELVCTTPSRYIGLAVELASNPSKLGEIKAKLKSNLPNSTLFDTAKLVTHLETLFESMWTQYCSENWQIR